VGIKDGRNLIESLIFNVQQIFTKPQHVFLIDQTAQLVTYRYYVLFQRFISFSFCVNLRVAA